VSQPSSLSSTITLTETPDAVAWARRLAVDVLAAWHVPPDVIETLRLVVSELATNAVRHPPQAAGVHVFELSLEIVGAAVRVSVWDRDPKPPVLREVGTEATGGRGLFMVATVSERWGHHVPPERLGKVVWADIPLAGAGARSRGPSTGLRAGQPAEDDADPAAVGGPGAVELLAL
jgi:anti-sigma regulatory factor (Ser/Thr protein kinase)